jgi:hypothetical protein
MSAQSDSLVSAKALKWRALPKQPKFPAIVVAKLITVFESAHHHWGPFALKYRLILFHRYLTGRKVSIFGLRRNRATSSAPAPTTICGSTSEQTLPSVALLVKRMGTLGHTPIVQYNGHPNAYVDVQSVRLPTILQIDFDPDWGARISATESGKFSNRSILSTQANMRHLRNFEILRGKPIRLDRFARLASGECCIHDQNGQAHTSHDSINLVIGAILCIAALPLTGCGIVIAGRASTL